MVAIAPAHSFAASDGRIAIHLLGPLAVTRANGSSVQPKEWRTAQTADLLRLLALHAGETVPVDLITAALWPKAEPARARGSLRTAVCQLRKVLGSDCLERRLDGLVLTKVWVDARAFLAVAAAASRCVNLGQTARAVSLAREGDLLYRQAFHANDDAAAWVCQEREVLEAAYRGIVALAADAAVDLGWMREAVRFATRSLKADPCSERASRALIRGLAGLGETGQALREFERCRMALAEELGVDPSAATRDLHLQLLRDAEDSADAAETSAPVDGGGLAGQFELDPFTPATAELEEQLRTAAREAAGRGDEGQHAEAALWLSTVVCTPRRQFALAGRWARQAVAGTDDAATTVRAMLEASWAEALLGDAHHVEQALHQAQALAHQVDDPELIARADAMRCLVAHDLGRVEFAQQWREFGTRRAEASQPSEWCWMAVRVATERGDLAAAMVADRQSCAVTGRPVLSQLTAMAGAQLRIDLGRTGEAAALLRSILDVATETGAMLLLPEAAARLIALEASRDLPTAEDAFELLDASTGGDRGLPRESCLRLLARAAIRSARGRHDSAAAAAASAAEVAESRHLPLLAAQSHLTRARHLDDAGRISASDLARTAAARWYADAGAPAMVERTSRRSARALGLGASQGPWRSASG